MVSSIPLWRQLQAAASVLAAVRRGESASPAIARVPGDRTIDGMMIGMRTMFTVGSILSSPSIVDGVLYVGSADGQVYAIR